MSARPTSMYTKRIEERLAIQGGPPVRTAPFPPWPWLSESEIEAAVSVLRSGKINYWTGNIGRLFEDEFAKFVGCKHAVALANGSVALEACLYALGIGPGDEVIVPSRTFIASASCVAVRGATPVFADIDRNSQNLTADSIREVLSPRTRAVIAVHLAGWPCDMDPILALAREHGLVVIEDCAQAHGATYKGRMVGSMGHAAAFSFCQDKILSTGGEGGMLAANASGVWERAWSYKDHGRSFRLATEGQQPGVFRWIHDSIGTNWRLTEVQAAIGHIALQTLDRQLAIRRGNAAMLAQRLGSLAALRVPLPPHDIEHACYKFYAFIRPELLRDGWDRDRVIATVQAEGVPCSSGSCSEVYLEKAFFDAGRPANRLPVARELGETSLVFLVHPTITERDLLDVCSAVEKVMHAATRPLGKARAA